MRSKRVDRDLSEAVVDRFRCGGTLLSGPFPGALLATVLVLFSAVAAPLEAAPILQVTSTDLVAVSWPATDLQDQIWSNFFGLGWVPVVSHYDAYASFEVDPDSSSERELPRGMIAFGFIAGAMLGGIAGGFAGDGMWQMGRNYNSISEAVYVVAGVLSGATLGTAICLVWVLRIADLARPASGD